MCSVDLVSSNQNLGCFDGVQVCLLISLGGGGMYMYILPALFLVDDGLAGVVQGALLPPPLPSLLFRS